MIRVGWLADSKHGYKGGAELCSDELLRTAPRDVEIFNMTPGVVHNNVDCYVIHNCTEYGSHIIPLLETRPVIKYVHDVWPHGDPVLKNWLAKHATLTILSSPLHRVSISSVKIETPVKLLPNAINLKPFLQAGEKGIHYLDACWIGRFETFKGMVAAAAWAKENDVTLDFYGYGPAIEIAKSLGNVYGQLRPDQVPEVLSKYKTFIFLPDGVEPYGRVVVEAWAAGCEVVTDSSKVGAVWWLENDPDAVENGSTLFWRTLMGVLHGS